MLEFIINKRNEVMQTLSKITYIPKINKIPLFEEKQ